FVAAMIEALDPAQTQHQWPLELTTNLSQKNFCRVSDPFTRAVLARSQTITTPSQHGNPTTRLMAGSQTGEPQVECPFDLDAPAGELFRPHAESLWPCPEVASLRSTKARTWRGRA